MTVYDQIAAKIRKRAGVRRLKVELVPGNAKPAVAGESYYWTNGSGVRVHHPSAYMRAWGKPVYHHSTRRLEVGLDYVREQWPDIYARLVTLLLVE